MVGCCFLPTVLCGFVGSLRKAFISNSAWLFFIFKFTVLWWESEIKFTDNWSLNWIYKGRYATYRDKSVFLVFPASKQAHSWCLQNVNLWACQAVSVCCSPLQSLLSYQRLHKNFSFLCINFYHGQRAWFLVLSATLLPFIGWKAICNFKDNERISLISF